MLLVAGLPPELKLVLQVVSVNPLYARLNDVEARHAIPALKRRVREDHHLIVLQSRPQHEIPVPVKPRAYLLRQRPVQVLANPADLRKPLVDLLFCLGLLTVI